jgi:hypothetical protein
MARCEPIAVLKEKREKQMSVFGFSTAPAGNSDFLPIVKYDARSGRITRVDRVQDETGNFYNEPVDITQTFKALADFENVETGWILFPPSSAPDFKLVPIGSQIPQQPTPDHKNGVRFMLKLAKECGGDKPIREIAGNSKALLGGVEAVYTQYLREKDANPGRLPVITMQKPTPVKSAGGSTNYHPTFKIVGWSERKDLVFVPKAVTPSVASQVLAATTIASPATAPSTGSTRAAAPVAETADADDFG